MNDSVVSDADNNDSVPKIPCIAVQEIFMRSVYKSPLGEEAHPGFLYKKIPQKTKQEAHRNPEKDRDVLPALHLEAIRF